VESSCERGNEPSGSIKCWEIYRVAAQLLASRVVLSPTELVSWLVSMILSSSVGIATQLRAGRSKGLASNSGRVKNFNVSVSCTPALGSTQSPIRWVPGGSFAGGKAFEDDKVDVYSHTPIHLHGLAKHRDSVTLSAAEFAICLPQLCGTHHKAVAQSLRPPVAVVRCGRHAFSCSRGRL
jgi:hypothetical protein